MAVESRFKSNTDHSILEDIHLGDMVQLIDKNEDRFLGYVVSVYEGRISLSQSHYGNVSCGESRDKNKLRNSSDTLIYLKAEDIRKYNVLENS